MPEVATFGLPGGFVAPDFFGGRMAPMAVSTENDGFFIGASYR